MEIEKIRAIELVLDNLSSCRLDDCDDIIEKLLYSICDSLNISLSANPTTSLFSDRTSARQKEFIAACLLRALSRKSDIFWGKQKSALRNKVFSLFDQVLIDIYKKFDINLEDKNEEKSSKLQDLERILLNDFSNLSSAVSSLEDCQTIKSTFMRLLFGNYGNSFLMGQFTNVSLLDKQRLTNLFELLDNYLNGLSVDTVIDFHKKIQKEYQLYIQEIEQTSSNLTQSCVGSTFKKILEIIQDDFNSKDELVPTEIEARILDRKYPFHVENREMNIEIHAANKGKGKAFDVEVSIEHDTSLLEIANPIIKLGSLEPGESRDFYFKAITQKSLRMTAPEIILGRVIWSNYSGENSSYEFGGELLSQDPHLDWQEMSKKKPYFLEAVSEEKELVGRSELIRQLYAKLVSDQLESSIIFGQKRVGKTSIAKTIQRKLKDLEDHTAIYMSVGSLDKNTPEKCLNSLGELIFDEVFYDPAFEGLKLPELKFDSSITPLDRFFRIIRRLKPNHKFVIIIDEFDEIPDELYQITDIGDNFFHNIRSLSSENNIAFVLVGGENMKIIKQSTDKLNKFESFSVDYFDSESFWNDFQELVKRPVVGEIEYTDAAVIELYEATEGNPFFTKLICGNVYRKACETRNAYVSRDEVRDAINSCLKSLDTNNVNHFWKDGITQTDPTEIDQIETRRRKFLIGYADLIRSGKKATKEQILHVDVLGEAITAKLLESFTSRKILIESESFYRCKPRFFNNWLIGPGFQTITSESLDEQAIEILQQRESRSFVEDTDITHLCSRWDSYRGSKVTPMHVRSWLEQFESNIEKRLMFTLLQSVHFYNEVLIREKLTAIHSHVRKGLFQDIKQVNTRFERVNKSILLSAFGRLSNSGPSYLRMYATANGISRASSNIVEIEKVANAVSTNERIQAIVFIEDIIASGGTVAEGLRQLNSLCGDLLASRKIKVIPAAICGFEDGLEVIESEAKKLPFKVEPFVCDLLFDSDKCFSPGRNIFNVDADRVKAHQIAHDYGYKLTSQMPLGYKDNQLLITFHETCPNNSLPILWADQPNWKALFSRK